MKARSRDYVNKSFCKVSGKATAEFFLIEHQNVTLDFRLGRAQNYVLHTKAT